MSVRIVLIACLTLAITTITKSQTVDEVVAKHIEAIGGAENWRKIKSLRTNGVLTVQGNEIKISMVQLHGKGMRQDILLQGIAGYQIITPTHGWTFMPFQGQTEVSAMSAEAVKQAQNELDTHGSLMDYKEKGHTAELAGTEKVDGIDCYKIFLTHNSGKRETVYIDSKNFYVVRLNVKQQINGEEQDLETNFSNFEKLSEGIVIPKSFSLPYGTMTLSKVEVNQPVDEKIFIPAKGDELR